MFINGISQYVRTWYEILYTNVFKITMYICKCVVCPDMYVCCLSFMYKYKQPSIVRVIIILSTISRVSKIHKEPYQILTQYGCIPLIIKNRLKPTKVHKPFFHIKLFLKLICIILNIIMMTIKICLQYQLIISIFLYF